jgi:hypothetical protein
VRELTSGPGGVSGRGGERADRAGPMPEDLGADRRLQGSERVRGGLSGSKRVRAGPRGSERV